MKPLVDVMEADPTVDMIITVIIIAMTRAVKTIGVMATVSVMVVVASSDTVMMGTGATVMVVICSSVTASLTVMVVVGTEMEVGTDVMMVMVHLRVVGVVAAPRLHLLMSNVKSVKNMVILPVTFGGAMLTMMMMMMMTLALRREVLMALTRTGTWTLEPRITSPVN
jgi:hypothetical protein